MQVFSVDETGIGGHQVPGDESNDVAGNDFTACDFTPRAIAQHRGGQHDTLAQPFDGAMRSIGLDEVNGQAQKHYRDDNRRVDKLAERPPRPDRR